MPDAGWPGDEHWGFVDRDGNVVVDLVYYDANFYSEGLAAVSVAPRDQPRWGMIDTDGNVVIPFEYDWLGCMSDGLVPFAKQGKFGYINRDREIVIAARFGGAFPFFDGRAFVTSDWLYSGRDDLRGRWIDRRGRIVERADELDDSSGFWFRRQAARSRLHPFEDQAQWGYRHVDGTVAIPARFQAAGPFSDSLARVDTDLSDGRTEFIDTDGHVVFALPYDVTSTVSNGRIVAIRFPDNGTPYDSSDDPPFEWAVYDAKGRLVFDEIRGYSTPPRHVELRELNLGTPSVPVPTQDQGQP